MPFHLPLSPLDRRNQPPVYYLQVQDALILISSFLWTIAYALYVRQAFRDKSYGMPLLCLWANIAWEFLFGVVAPTSAAQTIAFVPWLLIDVAIVYTTWRFGPDQWKRSPLVANNMGWIVTSGTILMTGLFWTFIKTVGVEAASFYIGYGDQLLISITSVAQLMSRNNTSGHSLGIWFYRASGTCLTILLFAWRYWHYADSYPRVAQPTTLFLFVGSEVVDSIYPMVYVFLEKKAKKKGT
ncbi:hypothetical protein HO133_005438 [Letharia lupina]|uniref:Integral membrane protein n=1 Tax=Letharia lupina TaxID=560253 RepID=A0A8H6C8G0_9LECA|nr:uncharacterized protein HO133_005438 [Letharia lupina]KAF6218895.1 hypothetical protein HO133_005438 [Letharia lupina]